MKAANCGRIDPTSTGWFRNAVRMPSAVACGANRSQLRPASIQCALSSASEANTAIPAELRTWRAQREFPDFGAMNKPVSGPASFAGRRL
jgi:hypothetical protein